MLLLSSIIVADRPPVWDRAVHSVYRACTTIPRYPIFNTRYSVMCKVYTEYNGTSEIEHGLCACTVFNPLAKARGLSLRTGAQTMLYLSLVFLGRLSICVCVCVSPFFGFESGMWHLIVLVPDYCLSIYLIALKPLFV